MKLPTDEQLKDMKEKRSLCGVPKAMHGNNERTTAREILQKDAEKKRELMPKEPLLHNGGLQNIAQLLAQGCTIAAYVMNSKTRAAIDEWIAQHPDRNAPFSAAPTEIDESVESIMVRVDEPNIDVEDNDQVLAKMKALVEPLPKPKPGDVSKSTGEVYGNQ